MSLTTRLARLERERGARLAPAWPVRVYQSDEPPPATRDGSAIVVWLPDNGRDDRTATEERSR